MMRRRGAARRGVEQRAERGEAARYGQEALARQRLDVVIRRHARLGPAAPLDGVAAAQLIDEGVGRAVGRLADDTELGARRGEAHEARAAAVALAQVQRARDLSGEHRGGARRGHVTHELIVDGARAVHDQLRLGQRGHLLGLAHVAPMHLGRAAADELVAPDEHHTERTPVVEQPARHAHAQPAEAARDNGGAGGGRGRHHVVEVLGRRRQCECVQWHETAHEERARVEPRLHGRGGQPRAARDERERAQPQLGVLLAAAAQQAAQRRVARRRAEQHVRLEISVDLGAERDQQLEQPPRQLGHAVGVEGLVAARDDRERAGVGRRRERVARRDEAVGPRQLELLHEGGWPVELHERQQRRAGRQRRLRHGLRHPLDLIHEIIHAARRAALRLRDHGRNHRRRCHRRGQRDRRRRHRGWRLDEWRRWDRGAVLHRAAKHGGGAFDGRGGGLRRGWRRQHDVGVGAADAEGRDAGAPHARRTRGGDLERQRRPRHVAAQRGGVDRGRRGAARYGEGCLDEAGDAGDGVQVAEVALDGANLQLVRPALGARGVDAAEGGELDRVPDGGARAVRLDVVHLGYRVRVRGRVSSTKSTSAAPRPASCSASRITSTCAASDGCEKPPLRAPSLLVATPSTIAYARATCRAVSTTSAAPSAGTVPLPAFENGRQTPSAAQIMPSAASIGASGLKEAPPQIAISHNPARSACTARATATSDEEHAVCTTSAGPVRPSPCRDRSRPPNTQPARAIANRRGRPAGAAASRRRRRRRSGRAGCTARRIQRPAGPAARVVSHRRRLQVGAYSSNIIHTW
eukprot:scaffold61227_cov54-Phaeocystis_antarctica.AAC.1